MPKLTSATSNILLSIEPHTQDLPAWLLNVPPSVWTCQQTMVKSVLGVQQDLTAQKPLQSIVEALHADPRTNNEQMRKALEEVAQP